MNKWTGIIVGAVLAAVVGGIVVKTFLFPTSDGPTRATRKPGIMKLIEMKVPITIIVDAEPTGSENAADYYVKAMEVLQANLGAINSAAAAISAGDVTQDSKAPQALKALEEIRGHLSEGAKQASMDFLTKHASGVLKVSKHSDPVQKLGDAFDMLDMLGDYYAANDRHEDAKATFDVMFITGWHMINDRCHTHMVMSGLDIQEKALDGMSRTLPKDTDVEEARKIRAPMRDYIHGLNEFSEKYEDKMAIFVKNPFDAGDIWNIANNDEDRAFRVLAVLAMGIVKQTHLAKGNVSYNNSMIEKFLKSEDSIEKSAAEAAKAYTLADFQTVSNDW
jgi:hypothetical protein